MNTYIDLARVGAQECADDVLYTFLLDGESREAHLSWAELDVRARAVAAELQSQGLAGCGVLLVYPAGLEYVVGFFACLYAGAVAVPAYPPLLNRSVSQLRHIIADAAIEVALTDTAMHAQLDAITELEPELASLRWIVTNEISDAAADDWRRPSVTAETVAFLQYTSGSTSAPKGVVVTHANLVHCGAASAQRVVEPGARMLSWLPQYHDLGLFFGLLQPVYGRNPIVLMSPIEFLRRPARWVEAISRYRVQVTAAPNFAYDLTARKTTRQEAGALDLTCWQVAVNAAESVQSATLDRFAAAFSHAGFRESAALNLYGLAEGLMLTAGPRDVPPRVEAFDADSLARGRARPAHGRGARRSIVSSGRAVDGQRVLVVDALSATECEVGRVGEIWVAGGSVGHGYVNRPRETGETFGARLADGSGPFLRTGDLGFVHHGELFVTGRSKDVIIVRGFNIYPQDLERTAECSHPALRPGCVAAVGVGTGGDADDAAIVVVQEVRPHWRGALAEAAAAIHRAVAVEHGLPLHAVVLIAPGRIPKTSSGKIRRRETRRMVLAGEFDVLYEGRAAASNGESDCLLEHDEDAPETGRAFGEIEAWLICLLSAQCNIPPGDIDTRAPFATFGLGSVETVEIATQLADWLRFPVPSLIAWDYPTIEGVARHLAARTGQPSDLTAI